MEWIPPVANALLKGIPKPVFRPYLWYHNNFRNATAPASTPASMPRFRSHGRRRIFRRRPVFRRRRGRGRRGRGRRGRRVVSAQAGNTISTRYRARRLGPRRFSSALLRDTLFKPHYRSLLTTSFTQVTPIGVNAATKTGFVTLLPIATPFWTVAGGALPIDNGVAVPTFNNSSIVLRGGRTEVTIGAPSVDAIKLRVFMLAIKPGAAQAAFNALVTVPLMWDPSHFVDFQDSYSILSSAEYILLPGSRPVSLIRNLKPRKIDFDKYAANEELAYCFTISQCTDINVLPDSVVFSVSHSLSFSGDIV